MDNIFLTYLLLSVTALVVFYVIGVTALAILRIRIPGAFSSLFLKQLTGIFIFTAICALYFTGLKTIFFGLIIPIAYFLIWYRRNKGLISVGNGADLQAELMPMMQFVVVICLLYGYRFYSIMYNGDAIPNIPNTDLTFYSRISDFMVRSGVESATPTLVYPADNKPNPYHYFDLWINGGLTHMFGGSNLLMLFLVSYTIGISLVWLGFCSLAEQLKEVKIFDAILALLAVFFLPLQSSVSVEINEVLNQYYILTHAPPDYLAYGLWNLTKTYPVYLIFIASGLALVRKQKVLAIIALSTLPFIYTTIAIPVVLFLGLYILVDYLLVSRRLTDFLQTAGYLALVCLFLLLFYFSYLFDSIGAQIDPFARWGVEPVYKSLLRPVKISFDATFQLLILYLPFIVLLIFQRGTFRLHGLIRVFSNSLLTNRIGQAAALLYISGLASWAILSDFVDANQFFVKTSVVMLNILCFIVAIQATKAGLKVLVIALSCYFISITTQDIFEQRLYSEKYMQKIAEATKNVNNIGAFLLSKTDYEYGYGDNIVEVLGDYITLFRSDFHGVNLSVVEIPDTLRQRLGNQEFYRFVVDQKHEGTFQSVEQSRIDFLDSYNIRYVIASPHVKLDSMLQERVKAKIVDDYSRQVFLLLQEKAQ